MYTDIFQKIGLSKNEAKVYESLLAQGELTVGQIATASGVHRRNVYDSLRRLVEKGLVYEIRHTNESVYQAVDPQKLMDLIHEQQGILDNVMPDLGALYTSEPAPYQVHAYRGGEGFKNYMRDILRINEDTYFIGVMGSWLDERWSDYFPKFIRQVEKQGIELHALFEESVKTDGSEIIDYFGGNYKFIPKKYKTPSGIAIFGDHVHIFTELRPDAMPDDPLWTVIINKKVADSFRTWFRLLWQLIPDNK